MARSFSLIVEAPDGSIFQETSLEHGELVFGRSASCDVMLTGENVSRRHVRLYTTSEGLFVEDLGSINGFEVEGRRVETDVAVRDGETIGIGDWRVRVREVAVTRAGVTLLTLTWDDPDRSTTHYEIRNSTTLVGRGRECGLVIPHPSVSRVHARLIVRPDHAVMVEDAGSSNGVTVNGRPIKVWQLSRGDRIGLGDVRLLVDFPGESKVAESAEDVIAIAQSAGVAKRFPTWLPWAVAAFAVAVVLAIVLVRLSQWDTDLSTDATTLDAIDDNTVAEHPRVVLDVEAIALLIESGDLDAATAHVDVVIKADPTNIEAVKWSNSIVRERRASARLDEGRKALEMKDRGLGIQQLLSVSAGTVASRKAAQVLVSLLPSLEKESQSACRKGKKSVGCVQATALVEKVSAAVRSAQPDGSQ